ncbi:MAG: hypothetical protein ABL904_02110 [Hyphomicrobiaceae bacterium]
MLHGIDADGATLDGVTHRRGGIIDGERLHQAQDLGRLAEDLPLMKALAACGVEQEFGIKSSRTRYNEHQYELRGSREHFGAALTARLKAGESPGFAEYPALPNLTIGLHRHEPFAPLTNMSAHIVGSDEGYVLLECMHASGRTAMFLWLSFFDERLGCRVFVCSTGWKA